MKNFLSLSLLLSLFGVSAILKSQDSESLTTDTPVRIYYHCSPRGQWDWDGEGEGGFRGFLAHLEAERREFTQIGGRVVLLGMGSFLRENPEDRSDLDILAQMGYDVLRPKSSEIPAIHSLGYGNLLPLFSPKSSPKRLRVGGVRLEFHHLGDAPSWRVDTTDLIFAMEAKGEEVDWDVREWNQFKPMSQPAPEIPVFLLTESIPKTGFGYRQGITYLPCPQRFAEVGKLDLVFRGRRLIRQNQEVFFWNKKSRNQNWKTNLP